MKNIKLHTYVGLLRLFDYISNYVSTFCIITLYVASHRYIHTYLQLHKRMHMCANYYRNTCPIILKNLFDNNNDSFLTIKNHNLH